MDNSARPALSGGDPPGRSSSAGRPVSVVATLADRPSATDPTPTTWPPEVRCVEVRADLAGDLDPVRLRRDFSGSLLYTLRSTAEGGACDDPPDRRRGRLIAAAGQYDFVDLEAARDLHPDVLDRIAPEQRVLSWQGPATDLAGLRRRFEALATVDAHLYRLAPQAADPEQALVPLILLKSLSRGDVTAYAHGPAGTWTRVLAARFGAPVMFGRLHDPAEHGALPPADGEVPLHRLLADYPLEALSRAERLYGIIGAATTMGLSPLIHNTSYRMLGLPALFLPFNTDELTRSLADLSAGLDELGLPLLGATVIRPHKEAGHTLAIEATASARRSSSACLILRKPSGWWADSEAAGVVGALTNRRIPLVDRQIAVIGCGGAGRAAAVGLSQAGAKVTLTNRGLPRGEYAAKQLGLPFVPLSDFDPHPFSVLVHATTAKEFVPFPVDGLDPATVIFDLNYQATETPLIAAARAAGCVTIDGKEMLLSELSRQFHLMTGHDMPVAEVSAALGIRGLEDGGATAAQRDRPSIVSTPGYTHR
jgi:3-dehydroquinate dehydratase/shikimate dehydrogenase